MTKLLVKNAKIAKSNDDNSLVYNFGITAYKSRTTGKLTCPMADECAKAAGCYAQQKTYTWPVVQNAYEWRYLQTESDTFGDQIAKELKPKLRKAQREGKQLIIRVHDSGDFYDLNYVAKWTDIMRAFPEVKFYAYTKMVKMLKTLQALGQIPENFTIIYSYGGLQDDWIDPVLDRHARVFRTREDLDIEGYEYANDNDLVAIGGNRNIGLVYHGAKDKEWTA